MNGRVYDPELGRFLSPDPFIQDPLDPQNFNRYSYVGNNPLSFVDPSGFLRGLARSLGRRISRAFSSIARAIRSVVRVIRPFIAVIAGIVIAAKLPFKAPAIKGFISGVISSGGDLRQGLISGLTAGAFSLTAVGNTLSEIGAVGKTVAHGTVGGLASVASGGNFRSGFIAGAAAKGATEVGGAAGIPFIDNPEGSLQLARNATLAAVVGGTGSVLGGGKFQNGAVTGAFSRLFNDLAHNKALKKQLDCKGLCHGNDVSGRPLSSPDADRALANATLSAVGAGIAGAGCVSSGTTCGFAIVLTADTLRQFNIAVTGTDPIQSFATDRGSSNPEGVAMAVDVSIGVLSISKVIQGIAARSVQTFSAGTAATTAIDIPSTANTLRGLSSAVEESSL